MYLIQKERKSAAGLDIQRLAVQVPSISKDGWYKC